MRVELKAIKGPAEGRSFVFEDPDIFVFGRALEAHCSLPSDLTISRRHFMLEVQPPDCLLTDLGSGNGTVVNDVRYGGPPANDIRVLPPAPVDLGDGDTISAGQSTFRVEIQHDYVCDRCKAPMQPNRETVLVGTDGLILCEACSAKEGKKLSGLEELDAAIGAVDQTTGVISDISCVRCGKNVAKETGLRALESDAQYVCRDCRRTEVIEGLDLASLISGGSRPPDVRGLTYVRRLGAGGQGAVYLARRTDTGAPVAVKTLLPSVAVTSDASARFLREIQTSLALRHPNVVEVYDHGHVGPIFYFTMEYVEGTDVQKLSADGSIRMAEREACNIICQALHGLAHAHKLGYVHRDLKPGNILLGGSAGNWMAKIADFGFAKSFMMAGLSAVTVDDRACGTLRYMPPEQITSFRFLKPASDVFGMAATLFYMLTGVPAKTGLANASDTPSAIRAVLNEPATPIRNLRPDISAGVAKAIDACLVDDPDRRPPNGRAMLELLQAAL